MSRYGLFLDRDGVLNNAIEYDRRPRSPSSVSQLELAAGAELACEVLRAAGVFLACVTNQPDIARSKVRREDADAINDAVRLKLNLDDLVMCPHDNADNCGCRKPKPGMLIYLATKHGLDLTRSIMVGDRWVDIEAGKAAGCKTVFIDHGWDERRPEGMDAIFPSLNAAVPRLLALLTQERTA